uniref:Uncharacterized protein n=1 Tax=Cajanus cajan TaxID=3821 RepID=A0A151QMS6_CAJCA|nr:hypothetical protein KK1_047989 [Cajanus cajan]
MQCANNSSTIGPPSQRKRVTAPSGKVDGKIFYTTPMPLHSSTISGGLLRSKDGKQKKEGSCFGTKGFRVPEVISCCRCHSLTSFNALRGAILC